MAFYKILAETLGDDTGPFVIKSQTGAILATGVTRQQLLDGFTLDVPAGVTSVTISNAPSNTTCTTTQTLPIPNEGSWEMEKSNVETISDHYGIILAPFVTPVETFVADDIVGIYAGVVSGSTGAWTIKGTAEDVAGTTYNPGGTLIITGVNTNTSTIVESGATLQIGYDLNNYSGQTGTNLNINAGGTVNVMGANDEAGRRAIGNVTNSGVLTFEGPDRCGEGVFRLIGTINNNVGGIITVKDNTKLILGTTATYSSVAGTTRVEDGATMDVTTATIPVAQTVHINGCGKCNEVGDLEGALYFSQTHSLGGTINVETASCMNVLPGAAATLGGTLTGSAPLLLTNGLENTGAAAPSGTFNVNSNTNTYSGIVTASNVNLRPSANGLSTAERIVLINGASLRTATAGVAQNIKSIASDDPNTDWTGDGVQNQLTANGITTFAGRIIGNGTSTHFVNVQGGSENQLTVTNENNSNSVLFAKDGAIINLEGKLTGGSSGGNLQATNGGRVGAGKSVTASALGMNLSTGGQFDVQAISPTQAGFLTLASAQFVLPAGSTTFPINLLHPMSPGTYPILRVVAKTGVGYGKIPTTVINNTGLTPSYSWDTVTGTLSVTLA